MVAIPSTELYDFSRFVQDRLASGDARMSPEDALALWRAEHPSEEELEAGVQAVQEALDDIAAGDQGRPAEEVLREIRLRLFGNATP